MAQIYKKCQSCSMPMKKDPAGGGTNADGSKSIKYCSYCFQNGQFTAPNMTVTEMQALVKGKLQEMGFPGFIAGPMTKGIPNLERWKT
ncbi:MAG: zinc ribbon domain-containing protein [Candidatus Falkowbacteria bacterium]|nr:zinc ribbon domain-containing protein [Candidatus Falkowbacteria bacterium]